jgi:hypothetical protein
MRTAKEIPMSALRRLSVLLAICVLAGLAPRAAGAKDVCLEFANGEVFVLNKWKKPKSGAAVPVVGLYKRSSGVYPFSGAVTRQTPTLIALTATLILIPETNTVLASLRFDDTFTGAVFIDGDGDFQVDNLGDPLEFAPVDCKTVLLP